MSFQLKHELFKKSSAGTHVDAGEAELIVDYKYSGVAWFFVTWFGTTRMPYEIKFKCRKTNEEFEVLTDKNLIEHYMLYRKK